MLFEKSATDSAIDWSDQPCGRPKPRSSTRRLIEELRRLAGPEAELVRHHETPWASITFSGARHTIEMRFAGCSGVSAGEKLVAILGEHEFAIPGKLVADTTATEVHHRMLPTETLTLTLEILLLDEA